MNQENLEEILGNIDISGEAPVLEPDRQYYFMKKARTLVKEKSEALGRPLTFCVNTFGCQMNATGAYSGAERHVVLCAVRNNEYPRLRELIRQYDPKAFLITTNVNEVLGEGFASLNAKNLT